MRQRPTFRRLAAALSCVVAWAVAVSAARADETGAAERSTFRVTGVLLLDRPAQSMATQLTGRDEAKSTEDFQFRIGNWDPRNRVTQHSELPRSPTTWRFSTGLHEWRLSPDDQAEFAHHVFLVDRPVYHQEGGGEKERLVHLAVRDDHLAPGQRLSVRWKCIGQKGLDAPVNPRLAAFWQQAPTLADEPQGWQPLPVEAAGDTGAVEIPGTAKPGMAWLRIGICEGERPTAADRLLAELPLVIEGDQWAAGPPATTAALKNVEVGPPSAESRVPDAWRQGVFLHPQSVSAVDISDDGRAIGVTTLAFRHDKNLWLLSDDGSLRWGRYVEPWAPFQVAVLGDGETCGVGLAYSRVTDPSPTVSHFRGEMGDETVLVDGIWDMGWLRYGEGDWRGGWPASLVGDLLARAPAADYTIFSHNGAWRFAAGGEQQSYPLLYQRPFRMASSADGHVVACGYLSPDAGQLDEKTRNRLRLPPAMLVVRNALTSANLWTAPPLADAAPVSRPPDAADDLPELAADFNIKPQQWVPFRAALSVALDGDGSTVAAAEYGGWMRIKRERGIGSWNPDHPVSYCPRQRGRLRVFDARGNSLADSPFPADGLFELHLDREGTTVWCAPQAWFARGMAGKAWLPADPASRTAYVYDLASRAWTFAFRLPDAVSDLGLHPDGVRALVSCWDGRLYWLDRQGGHETLAEVGDAARIGWSPDGRFAAVGTQRGALCRVEADGRVGWTTQLPVAEVAPSELLKPVFEDVPIYSIGRVGPEHAYVGDIWLVKTSEGGILVDLGGSSAIPSTWQRMRAAGLEPDQVKYAVLSHSHGDHAGTSYLWRAQGVKIVAPCSAELAVTWLMPTWSDYSLWAPARIDVPLPLTRVGDETEVTLCGQKVRAIFVPGHSFDATLYLMELGGKRVAFTGDIGFEGESHILHRCWGDRLKAAAVAQVVCDKLLAFQPDYVFTGHGPRENGTAFVEGLIERTDRALLAGDDVWPMPEWQTAQPKEGGVDAALLAQAREYALTGGGAGYVTRGGRLVASWGDAKQRFDLKSTSKSVGVTALGLAIADGKLALTDLAHERHPAFGLPPESNAASGWLDKITLLHLATQTAGFEKPGGYGKLLFEPGTQWAYSDGGPNWLAECVTLAYRQDVDQLLFDRVFTPLGITREDLVWRANSYRSHEIEGIARREFGSGVSANVDAMARIGYLYLREGRWQQKQIVPRDFVRQAAATLPAVVGLPVVNPGEHGKASNHYGLLWWNNADGTLADVPR
ncbi:MAG TPA: MBL fold metallo-hydrolase, partial [Pirellulales bacterium]|nr:MBL fold metallo-hydrolase [Pirellulales bacterium]